MIVEYDLEVVQFAHFCKDLVVDSMLRVGSQFTEALNPELTFQSDTISKFILSYQNVGDKFRVEEIGTGMALEIKDGDIYFSQYADGSIKNICIDADGEIVDESKELKKVNKYDFSVIEELAGYKVTRVGVHLANGAVLESVNAYTFRIINVV